MADTLSDERADTIMDKPEDSALDEVTENGLDEDEEMDEDPGPPVLQAESTLVIDNSQMESGCSSVQQLPQVVLENGEDDCEPPLTIEAGDMPVITEVIDDYQQVVVTGDDTAHTATTTTVTIPVPEGEGMPHTVEIITTAGGDDGSGTGTTVITMLPVEHADDLTEGGEPLNVGKTADGTDVEFLLNMVQGQTDTATVAAIEPAGETVAPENDDLVETSYKAPRKKATKAKKKTKSIKQEKVSPRAKQKKVQIIREKPSKKPPEEYQTQVWIVENNILRVLNEFGPKSREPPKEYILPTKGAPPEPETEQPAEESQPKTESNEPDEISYKCKVCLKEFPNKSSLRLHQRPQADGKMKCETGIPYFRCKVCFRRFQVKDPPKPEDGKEAKPVLKCDSCINKPRAPNMRIRKLMAKGKKANLDDSTTSPPDTPPVTSTPTPRRTKAEPKLKCPYCERLFVRSGYLRTHVQMMHPVELAQDHLVSDEELPYQCNSCGERFSSKPELRIHQCEEDGASTPKSREATPRLAEEQEEGTTSTQPTPKPAPTPKATKSRNFSATPIEGLEDRDYFACEVCLRLFLSKKGLKGHKCKGPPDQEEEAEVRPKEFGAKKYERRSKINNKNKEVEEEKEPEASREEEIEDRDPGLFEDVVDTPKTGKKRKAPPKEIVKEKEQPQSKKQKVVEDAEEAREEGEVHPEEVQQVQEGTQEEQVEEQAQVQEEQQQEQTEEQDPEVQPGVVMNEDIAQLMMNSQGDSEDIVPSTYKPPPQPKKKAVKTAKTPQQPTTSTPKAKKPIVISPTTSAAAAATESPGDGDSEEKDPTYIQTVTPKSIPQAQKRKKKAVEGVGDYECDICHLTCFTRSHLAYHKITHSVPSTEFRCHICNANFIRANLLNMHIAKKHASPYGDTQPVKRQKHSIS